jgi:uncharacterized Zn finger protein
MARRAAKQPFPTCPGCNEEMPLIRVVSQRHERPRLKIFECRSCGEFKTQAPDLNLVRLPTEQQLL